MTSRPRRNTRPRDALGRPLPYGSPGVDPMPEGVLRTPAETLAEARRQLEMGRPFNAHEVLEDAWKSAPPSERDLWQGLAQLAVGITHAARANLAGAVRLIARGIANVSPYVDDSPYDLDIGAFAVWSRTALAEISRAEPATSLELPPLPL